MWVTDLTTFSSITVLLDTGTIFFSQLDLDDGTTQPLKMIFKRHDHYTFQAFWEVAMLYSLVHSRSSDQYALLCQEIGREQVRVYEAWRTFLDDLPSNVHPIIVSSSIREVWLAVLEQYGETSGVGKMSVIAGNTLTHPYIVDTQAKALVAKTLRKLHGGCRIISFGDSGVSSKSCAFVPLPILFELTQMRTCFASH